MSHFISAMLHLQNAEKNIIFYGNNRQHIIKMWSHKHQTTPSVSEQIRSILRGIVEPLTTSGAFYLLK